MQCFGCNVWDAMFLDLYVGWWTDEYNQYCCSIGFPFWQGLRQDVQAKQQALHRLQQAQEVRRMHSAAQKDIVQHKEEEQVLRVAVQRGKEEQEAAVVREIGICHTCWWYSLCNF